MHIQSAALSGRTRLSGVSARLSSAPDAAAPLQEEFESAKAGSDDVVSVADVKLVSHSGCSVVHS